MGTYVTIELAPFGRHLHDDDLPLDCQDSHTILSAKAC